MSETATTVLVLGAAGMLGNAMLRAFASSAGIETWGSIRSISGSIRFPPEMRKRLIPGVDANSIDALARVIGAVRPDVVINCIGVVKQLPTATDPLIAIPINSILPHRLASLCNLARARLIHISTDCVFSGEKGMYREDDIADARDVYGLSKYLGEVSAPHAVTLRTSIIGPELSGKHGLIAWFLSQEGVVKGFTRAVFSGLPTVELARIVRDYVLPRQELFGLYHVSGAPISKYELLRHVARIYGKQIEIVPDDSLVLDRSLDSTKFRGLTGYEPPDWSALISRMYEFG